MNLTRKTAVSATVATAMLLGGAGAALAETTDQSDSTTVAEVEAVSVETLFNSPEMGVEKKVTLSDGSVQTLGWKPLSALDSEKSTLLNDSMAKSIIDLDPEMRPQSAFGCNGDVCIDLDGNGLYLNYWKTQATGNEGCVQADYRIDTSSTSRRVNLSPYICSTRSGAGVYYDTWDFPPKFADPSTVCNRWTKIAGYPCKTVHS